jgi:hypothetical protein
MKQFILIFSLLIAGGYLYAQPDPGADPGNPVGGAVPVDGGLAFLLAAGAGYGVKKAYDYKKSRKEKQNN